MARTNMAMWAGHAAVFIYFLKLNEMFIVLRVGNKYNQREEKVFERQEG